MDQQQPPVPPTPDPFQQPPAPRSQTPDPFSAYAPPPQKKASKTWLYILLGVLGLCVVCGIIGVIAYNVLTPQISQVMEQVQETVVVQLQPTLEAAQGPVSGQDFVGGNPYITGVTMARNVSGEMLDPQDPTMVFGSSDTFHAVTAIVDAPEGTRFRAAWYAVDVGSAAEPNTLIDSNDLTAGDSRNLDFSLTPASNWPSGTYRVEIYVNDTLDRVIHFSVE